MGSPVDDALDRLASRTWVDYGGREDDLATVRSELERLREERDEQDWRTLEIVTKQAQAAEAEVRRLREGLREISAEASRGIRAENRLPFLTHIGVIAETVLTGDPERHARALLAASPDGANTEGGEA